uniref:hypothetical protein n=1 Tax=Cupriavidus taiwanensis TaxID=164546 RepID=UPI0011C0647C|nr:hypothetical protein [Cupriavidus taiwanensis]
MQFNQLNLDQFLKLPDTKEPPRISWLMTPATQIKIGLREHPANTIFLLYRFEALSKERKRTSSRKKIGAEIAPIFQIPKNEV